MNRFKEASTWAGIGVFAQMLKAFLPPQYHLVADATSAVAAALAGVIPEKSVA